VKKITYVSWNYNAGSRHFATAEIEALQRRGDIYRLVTPDFKIKIYARKFTVFSSRRSLVTYRSLFALRSAFSLSSRLSLFLLRFSLFC